MDTLKNLLSSRLTQLAARYVGAFLVAKFGYDAAKADATVAALVDVVVAAALFGVDHLAHAIQKKVAK